VWPQEEAPVEFLRWNEPELSQLAEQNQGVSECGVGLLVEGVAPALHIWAKGTKSATGPPLA
jgi:hypothetical protein